MGADKTSKCFSEVTDATTRAIEAQEEAERKAKAHALACNPCPGRTSKQYQRINRALNQIKGRIRFHLEHSNYASRKWLPSEGVITTKDDEWQYDLYAQVEEGTYKLDDSGYTVVT